MSDALEFVICRKCNKEYAKWKWPYCRYCYKKYFRGMFPTIEEIKKYCVLSFWPIAMKKPEEAEAK